MARSFPPLKARAEWIPWALKCIRANAGDYRAMESCILARWRSVSQRTTEPLAKNSLRAVFGPTLRHLELITGEKDEVELTAKGEELLEVYNTEGELGFKKAFGKHLVKLDKEKWVGLVFEIQNLGESVSQDDLVNHLQRIHPDSGVDRGKLKKLLLQYDYAGVLKLDGKVVHLREPILQSIMTGLDIRLSDQEFVQALDRAYRKLRQNLVGSQYVPIPKIRDEVCKDTKIWPSDFDRHLQRLPKETPEYLIHLTEPMLRKPDGIKMAGKYLYYFAIYQKG